METYVPLANDFGGIQTHNLCIGRADVLPLDHRASSVAKRSSNPMFTIIFVFYTYTMCVYISTVYSVFFPSPVKKIHHRHITWVGFKPMTLAILEHVLAIPKPIC